MLRRSAESEFLMTPEQYLAQAESLFATGHPVLARQFLNLWQLRMYWRLVDGLERKPRR
jgi:hypothetical protein